MDFNIRDTCRSIMECSEIERRTIPVEKEVTLCVPLRRLCMHNWQFETRPGEAYLIQLYVIKFVSDLRQVAGFSRVLQFLPPIKLTATI